MNFIKIYGLPRSGTNFVQALLEENLANTKVLTNVLGNKHDFADPDSYVSENFDGVCFLGDWAFKDVRPEDVFKSYKSGRILYVFCIKSPLAWILSYYKLRKLKNPSAFESFSVKAAREFMNFWFQRISQWGAFVEKMGPGKSFVFDYEKVLMEQDSVFERVVKMAGLSRRAGAVSYLPFEMKRGIEGVHAGSNLMSEGKRFDRSFYLERKYLNQLPKDVLLFSEEFVKEALFLSGNVRLIKEVSGGTWTVD